MITVDVYDLLTLATRKHVFVFPDFCCLKKDCIYTIMTFKKSAISLYIYLFWTNLK